MKSKEAILSLFQGERNSAPPVFSGLIHVTEEGLQGEGLTLYEAHQDAQNMASAATSTFRLTEIPSAAVPLDLCAPAEALGSELNFYEGTAGQFPQPRKPLFASTRYLNQAYFESADFADRGRLPMIREAIRLLRSDAGNHVVISGIVPGPYTLLLYLIEPGGLFAEMKREPNAIHDALLQLTTFLSRLAQSYRVAGADFITVHEMGGSPGFIGPAKFEQFVFPALQQLIAELPEPTVLSVCGNTNRSIPLLARTGADAISVDQTSDLVELRKALTDTLLFGNIDPVAVLWQGEAAQIAEAAQKAKEAGVDAIWPGCDLVPITPARNIRTLISDS